MTSKKLRILRHALSGHSHRVELFCQLADLQYELVDVDLAQGEHKKEPFLALNSWSQIPVLLDGDVVVQDSNAIVLYLARRYAPDWIPDTPLGEAQMQRFFSIAAGELVRGPAIARAINVWERKLNPTGPIEQAESLLKKLNHYMQSREWFVGVRVTLADVALYTYISHAPEGGISLEPYGELLAWLKRVEGLHGFVAMKRSKVGLLAV